MILLTVIIAYVSPALYMAGHYLILIFLLRLCKPPPGLNYCGKFIAFSPNPFLLSLLLKGHITYILKTLSDLLLFLEVPNPHHTLHSPAYFALRLLTNSCHFLSFTHTSCFSEGLSWLLPWKIPPCCSDA